MANDKKKNVSNTKEEREETGLSFDLNPDDFEESKHNNAAKVNSNNSRKTETDSSNHND